MRLSTRGKAVSGTKYSPGIVVPDAPDDWIERAENRAAGGAGGVRPGAVGLGGLLAVSPPRSCSTADGLPPAPVSPFTPRLRSVRSMAGRAFSSAPVLSVMRNSRNALRCTMALARAGSVIPASSTTIRLSPTFWMSGSVDAELVDALAKHGERKVEVALGIGRDLLRLVELEGEMHAALEVESQLQRNPLLLPVDHDTGLRIALADGDGPRHQEEDAEARRGRRLREGECE